MMVELKFLSQPDWPLPLVWLLVPPLLFSCSQLSAASAVHGWYLRHFLKNWNNYSTFQLPIPPPGVHSTVGSKRLVRCPARWVLSTDCKASQSTLEELTLAGSFSSTSSPPLHCKIEAKNHGCLQPEWRLGKPGGPGISSASASS